MTGAASGIGRGAAIAFAREGSRLLLVDIDRGGLSDVESVLSGLGVECSSYVVNVSSAREVGELAELVKAEFGGLDVLVNVAGVGVGGDIADMSLEDWRWVLGVNLWGPIHTINAFLGGMIERRRGHVVNVASAGGFFAGAGLGVYCTSKFGLVGLSEALLQEVREHGVGVTAVCPGVTNTPILGNIKTRGLDRERVLRQAGFVLSHSISSGKTGEIIVRAVKRDSPVVITTILARLVCYLKRISPALFRALARLGRKYQNAFLR